MKVIVGIDFGTSTTVVRYRTEDSDTVLSVKDKDGMHDIIPSAIFHVKGNNSNLYGYEALSAYEGGIEGELITNFKMGLLKDDATEQKGYIKEFLGYVYRMFNQETKGLDYDSLVVYISYPAKWPDTFINFMSSAVKEAGFNGDIIGINEPKAATFFMLKRHLEVFENPNLFGPGKPLNIFMLDMGAGTTDIVMFRLLLNQDNTIDIDNLRSYPPIDNPYLCGGREIDVVLSEYVEDYISEKTKINKEDIKNIFTIDNAKQWKDSNLSSTLSLDGTAPLPMNLQNAVRYLPNGKEAISGFQMDRLQFENITKFHWDGVKNLIAQATATYSEEYGCGAEDFDLLFLTGGHSQWYKVPQLFLAGEVDFKKFREDPSRIFGAEAHPHESVAIGMCLQDQQVKIKESSANGVWVSVWVDKETEPEQIANVSDILPVTKQISPKFVITRSEAGFKEQTYTIHIDIYSGSTLETARKARMTQTVKNGGLVENLVSAGIGAAGTGLMFGGPIAAAIGAVAGAGLAILVNHDVTIEVPLEITVNDNNTIDLDGKYLFASGDAVEEKDMRPIKDDKGAVIIINKDNLIFED